MIKIIFPTVHKFVSLLVFLSTFIFGVISPATAQNQEGSIEPVSIGVVDRQEIIQKSLAGTSVREEFEAKEMAYREEIGARENILRDQQEELSRQRAILTPEAFNARESEFAAKVEQLQRDVNERNKKLENMLAYGMQQIDMAAIQIIEDIAEERKYTLVLDKTQLLMVAKTYEFSNDVVAILDERLPTVSIDLPVEYPQD